MKHIDIRICYASYSLACEEGQEGHISQLAAEIDMRARHIKEKMPRVSETMLLVMTTLTLADELYEARQEAGILHEKMAMGFGLQKPAMDDDFLPSSDQVAYNLSHAIDDIAKQLDQISSMVEEG